MLARFKVIVACDARNGIGQAGKIPWSLPKDFKFFKAKTIGQGNNAVVMGRETFLGLGQLPKRTMVVISSTLRAEEHPGVLIYPSLIEALIQLSNPEFDDIFIAGGERLYTEALTKYGYLCNKVYVSRVHGEFECDRHFPYHILDRFPSEVKLKTAEFTVFSFRFEVQHPEMAFLSLVKSVVSGGDKKTDRTGVGTISKFGTHLEFDISGSIPALTSKRLAITAVVKELLWMISGSTDSRRLESEGVKIWKANSSREFLDQRGLTGLAEGDIGCGYGFQWRHWGAEYRGCSQEYAGEGVDQLESVIEDIKTNPDSRRLIVSAWNVGQLSGMALPPCHLLYQFNVAGDRLDCQVYQRSADLFLGVPFNLLFYSVLTYLVGHLTGLKPRKLSFAFGDAHVYSTHLEAVSKLLGRTPRPWPTLSLVGCQDVKAISDFRLEHIRIEGYTSWDAIQAPMAV